MIAVCPHCPRLHDSLSHGEGEPFECACGHGPLVWERDEGGGLRLVPAAGEGEEEGDA